MAYQSYQVPQPPRRNRTLRTVLIVVGALLAVCCVGGGVGGYLLFRNVKDAIGPVRVAAEAFVTQLEAGNTDAAYDSLCEGTRRQYTRDAFAAGVSKQPKIRSHTIQGVFVNTNNGRTTGTVTMQLTLDTGFTDQHTFVLQKESDTWKVCGQPY
ncbi:DUF4878 domain-containing protein [Dactylosporangium sp. AC04546]|uniref:Rv0361 family membrane protein n=1 Tax=Dactylosporangium sp. AC04546 TaxID=2862460 RepID=UPI001EE0FAC6|nr:DUF4878 domain-containing protein [Dactylosporangium sp. AC04546]WVK79952.1 DUF4878 domain-containing protein [Dactylosporangium sp. AC04546]